MFSGDRQTGLIQQVLDHGNEFFRGVVAQKVADAGGVDPLVPYQLDVFVNADIEQVRQQPDVLAQGEGAIGFGIGPGRIVKMATLAIGR